jgi:hypothetical protein
MSNILCINELEMKLTAQTCQCAGFTTFLTNLISSSTFPTQDFARPWHREYWSGLSCEIYRIPLSARFDGLTFSNCASEIFEQNQALFFGIKPVDGGEVFLFPGSEYTLKKVSHKLHAEYSPFLQNAPFFFLDAYQFC